MHFTPWYRREDYALIREIMEDGEDLPLAFDEWEKNAECELAAAKREGTITIPVFIYPDEFFSFCNKWKIPLNKKRAQNSPTVEGPQVTPWECEPPRVSLPGLNSSVTENPRASALAGALLQNGKRKKREAMFFTTVAVKVSIFRRVGLYPDEKGSIITDPLTKESSVRGVYVAGDASRDVLLVAVAIAEGAKVGWR